MVTAQLRTNVHRIFDKITSPVTKSAGEPWFGTLATPLPLDIVINGELGGTLIYDFNFSVTSIIEITLDGTTFSPIAGNSAIQGRQSRYIRVLNGDKLNFRAVSAGDINRIVIGEV